MTREIKSPTDVLRSPQPAPTDYKDRLLKLIPTEIITAYVTLYGLVNGTVNGNKAQLLWIIIGILFVLTPVYLMYISKVEKKGQIAFTTFGFLIWVFATGSPVETLLGFQAAFLASLSLIIYTLLIPFVYRG
jgi:hypothetical protein